MDYVYIARQSSLLLSLLLCSVMASMTPDTSYAKIGKISGASLTETDANLTVFASYPTILEMQWEIFQNDLGSISKCLFEFVPVSDSTTKFRDCIQSSSNPYSLEEIMVMNPYINISNTEKILQSKATKSKEDGRSSTWISFNTRHWKQDRIFSADGSEAFENSKRQKVDSSKITQYFNITGLEACALYNINLGTVSMYVQEDGSKYYYTGEVRESSTLVDETEPPKSLVCSPSENLLELTWDLPFELCPPTSYAAEWTATSLWNEDFSNNSKTVTDTSLKVESPLVWAEYNLTVKAVYNDSQSNGAGILCRTLEQKPTAVQNVTVEAAGGETLCVKWNAPVAANGNISGYIIYIENQDTTTTTSRNVSAPETSYNVTDLEPCVGYSFSVVAVNGAGEGPPSDQVSQSLDSEYGKSIELSCCAYDTNISIEWSSIYRDCDEVSYQLQYSLSVLWKSENRTSNLTQVDSSSFSITGEDFIPGTMYDVIVSTVDEISASCNVTSLDAASSAPAIIDVSPTPVSIYVEWTPPVQSNGVLSSYDITFTDDESTTSETVPASVTFFNRTENIIGCMKYSIAVAAVNSFGEGEKDISEVTTGAILDVVCVTTSSSEISVSWNYTGTSDCTENSFYLSWNGTSLWEESTDFYDSTYVPGLDEKTLISGLHPFTDYNFNMVDAMDLDSILRAECTTFNAAPTVPRTFSVHGVTSDSMTLTWQEPASWNGMKFGYVLSCSGQSFNVTEEGAALTNLEEQKFYEAFLKACSYGDCSNEVSTSATTLSIEGNTIVIVLSVLAVGLAIVAGLIIAIFIRNRKRLSQTSTTSSSSQNSSPRSSISPSLHHMRKFRGPLMKKLPYLHRNGQAEISSICSLESMTDS